MASMADAVHHPLDLGVHSPIRHSEQANSLSRDTHVWVLSMVEPWVMAANDSLRSGDLGDEEEEEYDERVHGDRPAMDTTEDRKPKGREGRRQSDWERAGAPFALYGRRSMKQKYEQCGDHVERNLAGFADTLFHTWQTIKLIEVLHRLASGTTLRPPLRR